MYWSNLVFSEQSKINTGLLGLSKSRWNRMLIFLNTIFSFKKKQHKINQNILYPCLLFRSGSQTHSLSWWYSLLKFASYISISSLAASISSSSMFIINCFYFGFDLCFWDSVFPQNSFIVIFLNSLLFCCWACKQKWTEQLSLLQSQNFISSHFHYLDELVKKEGRNWNGWIKYLLKKW